AHGLCRMRVETVQLNVRRAILVVISFDAGHPHAADDVEAFLGVGVVAHDVAEAGVVRALALLGIRQHHLQRLEVGMYIGYDCVLHVNSSYPTISNPAKRPSAARHSACSCWINPPSPDSRIAC